MEALEGVLKCLQDDGIKLKLSKYEFFQEIVKYLGHKIDATSLHPTAKKIKAVVRAPKPRNVYSRIYLGLLNYYS